MDKGKIFNDIKSNVETFCHRNFITSDFNKNSRWWRINFNDVTINVILSKNLLNITFFAVLSKKSHLEAAQKLVVYEKLLKLNANLTGPGFSLSPNDEILLTYTRSVEDLDYNELSYLILATRKNLESSADLLGSHVTTEKRAQPSSTAFASAQMPLPETPAVQPEPTPEPIQKQEVKTAPVEKAAAKRVVQKSSKPAKAEPVSDFSDEDDWEF